MLIVNVKGMAANHPEITYVGRSFGRWVGSPLGSPIHRGQTCPECGEMHTRDVSTVPCYARWLKKHLHAGTPEILAALRSISPTAVLGCWCCCAEEGRPADLRECHAEVVAAAVRWLNRKDAEAAGSLTPQQLTDALYTEVPCTAVTKTPRRTRKPKVEAPAGDFDDSPVEDMDPQFARMGDHVPTDEEARNG